LQKVVADVARILQDGFDPEIVEIHHRFRSMRQAEPRSR
jgi:dihydrodipicolinate reductase